MKMTEKTKYISYLSVIACIAVVYMHANGCFWTFSTEAYWRSANIIECVCYFAVPIFFMIPGATLLNFYERYDLKTYFKKRAVKTLIPFLAWSIIALLVQTAAKMIRGSELLSLKEMLRRLVTGEATDFYWFFPALFCVYLCIPLFAAVPTDKRKEVFSYLAAACFLLNILIPFVMNLCGVSFSLPYSISVGAGYLFYVLAGYLLNEYDFGPVLRIVIYVLAVGGLLAHVIGTYTLSMEAGEIVRTFKGYNNLPCVLYSIGIFVFVKTIIQRKQTGTDSKLDRLVMRMKKYTLSIYLIHWFVIHALVDWIGIDARSLVYRLLSPVLIIAVTMGITLVLRKIPFLKKIVPE